MLWFRNQPSNSDLQDDIAKLRRQIEGLELEWVNFYDKAKSMMGRIAKRAERVESAESTASTASEAQPPLTTSGGRLLTPRQIQVQQEILRRRANGGV